MIYVNSTDIKGPYKNKTNSVSLYIRIDVVFGERVSTCVMEASTIVPYKVYRSSSQNYLQY